MRRPPLLSAFWLALWACSALHAAAALADDSKKPKVLDFEGDVIEGQKKTPELFLQTEVERPTLDTVLYQRKHFNDFHGTDSKRRPRASDPPR